MQQLNFHFTHISHFYLQMSSTMDGTVRQIENLFPEVETNYLRNLIGGLVQQGVKDLIGVVCDQLSDDNYPKKVIENDVDDVHVVGFGRHSERQLDEETLDLTSNTGVKKGKKNKDLKNKY